MELVRIRPFLLLGEGGFKQCSRRREEAEIDYQHKSAFSRRRLRPFPRVLGSALLLSLLAIGLLAGGCGKSADKPSNAKPKIALVMKSLANEFFSTMADGAKKHQAAHAADYELIVNGIKNETDLAEQVGLVEQMIARRVNAIVIAPADSKALVTVLKRAQDAGIAVVNIDNKLEAETARQAGLRVPFVGPDNREGARRVGEALAKHLKPSDKVALIEGIPTAFNGQQRRLGFEEAMKAAGVNIVTVQSGYWEMDKANNVAAAILNEHADLLREARLPSQASAVARDMPLNTG